jgi:2-succinyl-5-enolpyruvyl-6-hydroxy-3-cyclohexene-1-carboxylate synthase
VTAQAAIEVVLDHHEEITEPGIARRLTKALPDGSALVVASSMPVRDVEWYGIPRAEVRFFANRGANGIDGVASTARGVAMAPPRTTTTCLLGDLAFLHDLSGVAATHRWGVKYVVVDNNGGGIFSFLPQASSLEVNEFEWLFGTPHDLDLVAVAQGLGYDATEAHNLDDILLSGAEVVVCRTDRAANVKVHDEIHAVVADALRA